METYGDLRKAIQAIIKNQKGDAIDKAIHVEQQTIQQTRYSLGR
jgi:hypothetical protein